MRLNRYLAQCGLGSRRSVEDLIADGVVTVNGRPAELGTQVEPGRDKIAVRGRLVEPPSGLVYLALNKPRGYDVTRADRHSHRQVYDLLPRGTHASVKAVGRLDRDSTGLLLLTNDGDLAYRLTHPSFGCPKVYDVAVEGQLERDTLAMLAEGVTLDDGPARAEKAEMLGSMPGGLTRIRLTMNEGRKRIVRRMCEAVGHPVVALERVSIGPLPLGKLKRGAIRPLTGAEVRALRKAAGLD